MTLLITGGSGYLGGELVRQAGPDTAHPRLELLDPAAVRAGFEAVRPSAVIHTAYRQADPRVNTDGSAAVAEAAAEVGARLIHLSTDIVFDGRATTAYTEDDEPNPLDDYGRSKLEAERGLAELGLDWAALRPVLVYGPGVKGNMAALLSLAQSPWPLPLGGLTAKRSLLSLDNLAAAVDAVLKAEGSLRRPFIAADPEPVTIPEMVTALRRGLGRGPGLIPVPSFVLKGAATLAGKGEAYQRLAGSLVASPEALKNLGWQPVSSTRDALAELARQAGGPASGA